MSTSQPSSPDAFILGLDGIPWPLIERWTDDGSLPNFARIRNEGTSGPLKSTVPASTPLAWPSIATGVRPDKHGVYWFQKLTDSYTHRVNTSNDIDHPSLWEMVSPAVVANVPMTYPSTAIDGTMVSGMMTPSTEDEGFTHPPSLAEEIRERIPSYEIGLDWTEYADNPERIRSDIRELVDARAELLDHVVERDWRLCFFVFTAPDRLQHLLWDEDVILDHYQRLDDILGRVLDIVSDRGANLFVVSDHGFGPVSTVVSGNAILEREGFLTRSASGSTSRSVMNRLGIDKDRVSSWLHNIGVDRDDVVENLPQAFVDMIAFQIPGEHPVYDLDYSETKAFFHGPGCLFVNDTERFDDGVVDPQDIDAQTKELTELFARVTDPETGERVLQVYDGDSLFPTDPLSPDLIIKGTQGYEAQTKLTDEVFLEAEKKAASHRSEGIVLAWGPDIASGVSIEEMSVYDVAPTVLQLLGQPIPAATDGRIVTELFDRDTPMQDREVKTTAYSRNQTEEVDKADSSEVEKRLRGLGYLE